MSKPVFLITIDTEGDNLWGAPRQITTHNSRYLPRFQSLCEHYGLRPTWLTNYEMAICPLYQTFAKDMLRRNAGEVGMHLHAWNSPPLTNPLTRDDFYYRPYLIEYPEEVMQAKIHYITELLESEFALKMRSHRAGRWSFNETYARILLQQGYEVDCSVTPYVSWKNALGDPDGCGGSDFCHFPATPYTMDLNAIHQPGPSALLQLPVSIRKTAFYALRQPLHRLEDRLKPYGSFCFRVVNRLMPELRWLRPLGNNLQSMLTVVKQILKSGEPYAEFMLHSSELMPGGSPTFQTEEDIERLYADLDRLFAFVASTYQGQTLAEFYQHYQQQNPLQASLATLPQESLKSAVSAGERQRC